MDPLRKYTVARDILQLEETYRDELFKAAINRGDRYRQLIDKLLSADSPTAQADDTKP